MQQLAAELVRRATDDPAATAVIDDTGVHTVAEVVDRARELADVLAQPGENPTVLVQADNSWRTLATAVAVGLRNGFLAVFSRHAAASEFQFVLEDVAPDVVVADAAVLQQWTSEGNRDSFPGRPHALDGWVVASAPNPTSDIARWRGASLAALTSGSTGRPKCVVHSEAALAYAGSCTVEAVGLRPGEPVGTLVPLSSVAAACFGMYLPAMNGSPMVCLNKWSPDAALTLMREHAVAWTMLVPTMALQLSTQDGADGALHSLRAMTVGGGPMDAGALERAERTLGTRILRVFGMSECLGHTTPHPSDPPAIRLGRDGRPFPGTTVRAVDEQGRVCGPGEIGAGQVKGPSLFMGYAKNGAPTPPDLTEDGFLPTGDLLEVGADGTVLVRGREKQMVIRGGRNIDINEVEAAVAKMPQASQVCVVPVPDEMLGERAAALVVSEADDLGLADVTEFLAQISFPKSKWPEYVFPVRELPLNRVGKLSRADAIELATQLARQKPS